MTHTSDPVAHDPHRAAGVLLHPTSLPGRYGIGDLGDELIAFLDWTRSAGLRVWQVLPLNPPGYGHSPYGCLSSFAGNPLLISPQRLLQSGLLTESTLAKFPELGDGHVDFARVIAAKTSLLRTAFHTFEDFPHEEQTEAFEKFRQDNKWLSDWTLFAALKKRYGGQRWSEWPKELATRERAALADARAELADEVRFHTFVQWQFFTQWAAVREAAFDRGIRIMGDIPIYVAEDSADVWSNRDLFQLDERGEPAVVAGVPPDYFSTTGQRWGNPLYDWERLRATRYRWWIARIRANLRFADILRLDHFRGFAAYWEIPGSEPTAIHGRWTPGPGKALFDEIRDALGEIPLVAEDLGFITDEVHELRKAIGIAGMKILQFGFAQPDSPHLPHRFEPHTVVYTGTHDNDTARGWFGSAPAAERELALEYMECEADDVAWAMTRLAFLSVAQTAIVPVQDILDLGSLARMNLPGARDHNWTWRMKPGALTNAHAGKLRRLAEISGRV